MTQHDSLRRIELSVFGREDASEQRLSSKGLKEIERDARAVEDIRLIGVPQAEGAAARMSGELFECLALIFPVPKIGWRHTIDLTLGVRRIHRLCGDQPRWVGVRQRPEHH